MKKYYDNQNAYKIKTTNGKRSLQSRVCGMDLELATKVLNGEIGINTAIKMTMKSTGINDVYEYCKAQDDQKYLFNADPNKEECKDGRGWMNASDKNMTRRGHQG